MALTICWAADISNPLVYSDSKVACDAVNGVRVPTTPELDPLIYSISEIRKAYHFEIKHVKRREVSEADWLAKKTLSEFLAHQRALSLADLTK